MLVEDQDGQKMVVVNPGPGEEPQTIVIPEQVWLVFCGVADTHFNVLFTLSTLQAETVYVIASRVR